VWVKGAGFSKEEQKMKLTRTAGDNRIDLLIGVLRRKAKWCPDHDVWIVDEGDWGEFRRAVDARPEGEGHRWYASSESSLTTPALDTSRIIVWSPHSRDMRCEVLDKVWFRSACKCGNTRLEVVHRGSYDTSILCSECGKVETVHSG